MFCELVPNALRSADIRFDRRHFIRGWGRDESQKVLEDKDSSGHGGRLDAIGTDRQDSGHAQDTSTLTIALEIDALKAVFES